MNKELLKGLTDEQIAKLRDCKTPQEALKLAKEEGIELNDEQLEAVTGGACEKRIVKCPICQSDKVTVIDKSIHEECHCDDCGFNWRL